MIFTIYNEINECVSWNFLVKLKLNSYSWLYIHQNEHFQIKTTTSFDTIFMFTKYDASGFLLSFVLIIIRMLFHCIRAKWCQCISTNSKPTKYKQMHKKTGIEERNEREEKKKKKRRNLMIFRWLILIWFSFLPLRFNLFFIWFSMIFNFVINSKH